MQSLKTASVALLAASAIGMGCSGTAVAATSPDDQAIQTVISAFTAGGNTQGLKEFKAAPRATQLKVAQALTGNKDISNQVTLGTPVASTPAASKSNTMMAAAASYTTYSVTASLQVPAKIFGITIATYHQKYDYTTGNGRVLSDRNCRGYWDGFSGANTYDYTVNHYVSGGHGYCTVYDQVSLVYKGLGATYEKVGHMEVDGKGIVSWYLKND